MTEAVTPAAPPATPVEAGARLTALRADSAWGAKVLAGDSEAVKEFHSLHELAAKADPVDLAMAGVSVQEIPTSEERQMTAATQMFREIGIRDDVIRQTLGGYEVSQKEFDAVKQLKQDRMSDAEWAKAFLGGSTSHQRDMTLMNIVLSSSIKEDVK